MTYGWGVGYSVGGDFDCFADSGTGLIVLEGLAMEDAQWIRPLSLDNANMEASRGSGRGSAAA